MTSENTEYSLKPIVIIAADEKLSSNDLTLYQNKVQTCVKLVQAVISELLEVQGFPGRVLSLENKDEIDVFTSVYTVSQLHDMDRNFIWESLAREIFSLLGKYTHSKVIGFLTCAKYVKVDNDVVPKTYIDVLRRTRGYAMCAVGGFALIGMATFYAWPSAIEDIPKYLTDKTIVDRTKYQDGSCMRGTWGSCYSSTMGAILHEILHLFDVVHYKEGIMGQGFMDMDKFLLQHFLKGTAQLQRSKIELFPDKTSQFVTIKSCWIAIY
ncbi:uncharacterized protein LOC136024931 isoform X2 [Artemia franciscana]|uniref:uncharacterized protein LOC136024931 isoform X2 n=1 Tax=Artemia franciscana TaxID=6661 RepID=UPI0032DA6F74